MAEDYSEEIQQHAVAINHLIALAAQQNTLSERLMAAIEHMDERLDAQMDRLDTSMARQDRINERLTTAIEHLEERQGRHEARMDAYMQRQDTLTERLTQAIERIDQTLAQLLKRSSNGREA